MGSKKDPRMELFEIVEASQGYAFIADTDAENPNKEGADVEALERARNSLWWTLENARRLRKFIRKMERRTAKTGGSGAP